jgi:dynein heavy chain, axonemal
MFPSQRQTLIAQIDTKLELIFQRFGLEVLNIQDEYQRNKDDPVVGRHCPPVSGAIGWSRLLLERLQNPMKHFLEHEKVIRLRHCRFTPALVLVYPLCLAIIQLLASPSAKRIVKSYNKIVKTLVAFEYVWYDAWAAQVDKARSGLLATLIVRHPASKKLLVNFDPGLFGSLREALVVVTSVCCFGGDLQRSCN